MSEKLLKILLSELETVRVLCQGPDGKGSCPGIVELSVERMVEKYRDQRCPLCGIAIPNTSPNYLELLGQAITGLNRQKGLRVEFVIPQKD